MPQAGKQWRHVVIGTDNSWLPGDPRGFRTEDHKIHSSGDYKNPPPEGEHAGLFLYSKRIGGDPVVIPAEARGHAGRAIVKKLCKENHRVLAVSASGMHSHWLVELPDAMAAVRHIVGQCKSAASHAIREQLPGRVWGRYGSFKRIDSQEYQRNVYYYIINQNDAWIWSYRDEKE